MYTVRKATVSDYKKVDSIQLSVWNFNKDAIEFYKSMGMTVRNIKMELEVR